ncbi:unnamed protein product [Timema podura]|uniref:Uncharacterized protein n=1 Tax=Timema podura TaxID=61482 RepID=A0ABN7P8P6_TIMPD|nr:unnamed protein product [Timema podura]
MEARSSSQATLDSLDLTRYSEDGERGVDERVAVLEFELRKAKETISALRANLTVATDVFIFRSKVNNEHEKINVLPDDDHSLIQMRFVYRIFNDENVGFIYSSNCFNSLKLMSLYQL